MKYIITGHKGLIGTYLKDRLDKEHQCIGHFDQREGFNLSSLDGLKLNAEIQGADILFHLAAHCKINEGTENPELPHINNTDGTHHVLEFMRKNKIPKIVNFSSSRVLSPERNPYVASKLYGEELVKAYGECYGLEWITVRPSTVYGPYHDITSRLMTTWCQKALKNEEFHIFGNKDKTLDFTYVTDFVDGVQLLLDNWDETKNNSYNISGEEEVNLCDLAMMVVKETDGKGRVGFKDPEIAQPQQVAVDISKIKKYGFEPKVDVKEGVKRMIEFYRQNGT